MVEWFERHLPKMVLAPSFVAIMVFVYGFIGWTAWVSLTRSRLLPKYEIEGFFQYGRLFDTPRWDTAMNNLFIFGLLFIGISMLLGLLIAILLDQKIRTEGVLRTIYLYPMALSLIVRASKTSSETLMLMPIPRSRSNFSPVSFKRGSTTSSAMPWKRCFQLSRE